MQYFSIELWPERKIQKLLELKANESPNSELFAVKFFSELYLRYSVREEETRFAFEPDVAPVWINGYRYKNRSTSEDVFFLEKISSETTPENKRSSAIGYGNHLHTVEAIYQIYKLVNY